MEQEDFKKSDRSVGSDGSVGSPEEKNRLARLRPSGGYRRLRSFQVTSIIYDATVSFCERFVDKRSRTVDQMVQAARSGRQNIAEGSRASAASSQTELRLVNVARASLDELLLDYEDFLRQRNIAQWGKEDSRARQVRAIGGNRRENRTDRSDPTDRPDWQAYTQWLENPDPAVVANAIICLVHQANYLLDRQIEGLERQFIQDGGYTERLAAARMDERQKQTIAAVNAPVCPVCGKAMAMRMARKGARAGTPFWGCTGYPGCKGLREVEESDRSVGSDGSVGSLNPKNGPPTAPNSPP